MARTPSPASSTSSSTPTSRASASTATSIFQHDQHNPSVAVHGSGVGHSAKDFAQAGAGTPVRSTTSSTRRASRSRATSGTASTIDGTTTIGSGFDDGRGHAMAYFGYRKVKPAPRCCARLQRLHHHEHQPPGNPACGGSATAFPGNSSSSRSGPTTSTTCALGPGTSPSAAHEHLQLRTAELFPAS